MAFAFARFAAILAIASLAAATDAQEYSQGDLIISHPWARPTARGTKIGAAYMAITNKGKDADLLKAVSSPAAEKVEIHENIHDGGGVMRMRQIEGGLPIAAEKTIELKPGGFHYDADRLEAEVAGGTVHPHQAYL